MGYYKDYEDGRSIEVKQGDIDPYIKSSDFETKLFAHFICLHEFYSTHIPTSVCSYMFKRELICQNQKVVSDRINVGEDVTCLFHCFLNMQSIAFINWSGYHYRQRRNSIMHTCSKNRYEEIEILYYEIKKAIELSDYNQELLKKKLCYVVYYASMMSCYENLWKKDFDYLFPYPQVTFGSRLVIYGAGVMGQQLFSALEFSDKFKVVGWSDKGWQSYKMQGLPVISPQDILQLEYDYLIISVTRKVLVKQIEEELLELGIEKRKIAVLDEKLLTQENLPFE